MMETRTAKNQGSGSGSNKGASSGNGSASFRFRNPGGRTDTGSTQETKAAKPKSSPYDNIKVSFKGQFGSVNIRTDANTSAGVAGKIYNDSAATIPKMDGEGGARHKIQSGSVTTT